MAFRPFLLLLLLLLPAPWVSASNETAIVDPWEPMNRRIFAFNEGLDKYLLRPVARGYHAVTPDPLERGVRNFLENLTEVNRIANAILQGRAGDALHGSGRLLVNTTLGFGGIFEVATPLGLERRPSDFGKTLAVWGVGQGPFLMLPMLGPRTVRSSSALVFDNLVSLPNHYASTEGRNGLFLLDVVDLRVQLLDAEQLLSGDRYIFTRNAYLQRRASFVSDGQVIDSFSAEKEEDEEEFVDF